MKTIHKLILKSYLGPMILTFFIVMFVLMMNFLWRYIDELVGKGLDAGIIIELLSYAMANLIPMGLPLATLLAAIMTMGNLGENYELLAMKSAGMSLPQIIKPLIIVVGLISIGSFFIVNDLVPAANKKFYQTMADIRQMKQTLEFKDGLFFNGIDDLSIRVGHQDPETGLLNEVLIYDNRGEGGNLGNMTTTLADSGYIRISDDKRFLVITLYNGESYEQARTPNQWYSQSTLKRNKFKAQKAYIPISGFKMERSDENQFGNMSQTRNIAELQDEIDTLELQVNSATNRSYDPLLKGRIFAKDTLAIMEYPDTLTPRNLRPVDLLDSLPLLDIRQQERIWSQAAIQARNSRSVLTFDETQAKWALSELYRNKVEWHRKLSLPVSIMIFFLIGAPLGAIIRKGGLGMPIVISIGFFVIYYIISISGEKMAKEGTWEAVYGMWLSSFILTPIAVYLTYKATNDSGLLDVDWYIGKFKKMKEKTISLFSRFAYKNKKRDNS